jgi:hypothetical protein
MNRYVCIVRNNTLIIKKIFCEKKILIDDIKATKIDGFWPLFYNIIIVLKNNKKINIVHVKNWRNLLERLENRCGKGGAAATYCNGLEKSENRGVKRP